MKSINTILGLIIAFASSQFTAQAQCPGCTVDNTCTSTSYKLCPQILPDGTQGSPYGENITVFVKKTFFYAGANSDITLEKIKVVSLSGLPFGLNWQTNVANNEFALPNADNRYCVRICGTPVQAGSFVVTVNAQAFVTAPTSLIQDITFEVPITILPSQGGNTTFGMQPSSGCMPINVAFTNTIQSNGYVPTATTTGFTYRWNFGSGATSTAANPPVKTYASPGDFPVTYHATIDTVGFKLTSIKIQAINCTDGPATHSLDQAPFFYSEAKPELYLKIWDNLGNLVYTTEANPVRVDYDPWFQGVINPLPYTFPIPDIRLKNAMYTLQVIDQDGGLAASDDNCINNNGDDPASLTFILPPNTSDGFGERIISRTQGGLTIEYTINKPVLNIDVNDTVRVFPLPTTPLVNSNPADGEICEGENILLLTSAVAAGYKWYKDNAEIGGASTNQYVPTTSGSYNVEVFNTQGCTKKSSSVPVAIRPIPLQIGRAHV